MKASPKNLMTPSNIRAGVDTSVLMRLLTGTPETLFEHAVDYVAETEERSQSLIVSSLVLSEVYFACQHHYGMAKRDVLEGMYSLLSKPVFRLEVDVQQILGQVGMATAKPGFIDRLIHLEYKQAGTGLVTFEKSAAKLPGSEVLT